jgi:DNA/RNA-binding domain of Phe-tRNA-synthetase-like protein
LTTVTIDEALRQKCPRVTLGCVTGVVRASAAPQEQAEGSTLEAVAASAPEGLSAELHTAAQKIAGLPDPNAVLESPAILATRRAYKALGKDPARYRGSAEALLRRVISGKGLPRINPVVDVINLVSLESRMPIGLYDLAHVNGDVVFRAGRPGETYKGIGKYDLNLEDLPLFADAEGPHGSATSDSERTMVTAETTRVLAIIVSFAGSADLGAWAKRMIALLERYADATLCETWQVPPTDV